ncbi:MAG: response regulator, partial [Burkholderiales bacterium]
EHPIALVVEDHDAVRRALCERIHASFGQFLLREAGTVHEALKIVESEKVDLVLMDFRLPGMDGVDGTRMVLERSPHTSVVMVSGYDDSSHRSAARKAGARAFVSKRAISRELIPLISSLVYPQGAWAAERSAGES